MRQNKLFVIIFSCLVLWFFGLSWAWGQSDHTAKLIEGAKKERKFVWYTSVGASDSKHLLDAFTKNYPFVKAELLRASGENILNRIMTETQAGRWQFDNVSMGGDKLGTVIQRKLLSRYVSPEAKAYSPKFKDARGYWTTLFNLYYVIGYNMVQVSEAKAPRRWEDLLKPEWRGKISIDREEYEWYATLVEAWGEERTQRYMSALAKQQIQWRKGHTLIAQLMAAGEFPVAIVYAHRIEEMKKKGAPVEWVDTLDPIVVSITGIGISARPNNPNTAKLFIDFVLSKEGQEMIRSFDRIPPRSDVEPLSTKMDQTKLKLQVVPQDMESHRSIHEFRRIFGL